WTRDNNTYTISYQNDASGNVTQRTYPSGRVINSNYDANGRIGSISQPSPPANYLNSVTYNVTHDITADTFVNCASDSFGSDQYGLQPVWRKATASGGATGGLMNLNFSYQAAPGQMGANTHAGNANQIMTVSSSSIHGLSESASYTYDLEGRLAAISQTSN